MTEPEKWRRGWGCWVAEMLPLLYVLSAGPAIIYIRDTTGTGHGFVNSFYEPVFLLAEGTPLGRPLG